MLRPSTGAVVTLIHHRDVPPVEVVLKPDQAVVADVEHHKLLEAGEDVNVRDVEQQQNIQEREAMEALDVIVVKGQVLQHGGSLEQDRRQHSQSVVIQLREERSLSGIVTI